MILKKNFKFQNNRYDLYYVFYLIELVQLNLTIYKI